ncbi:hypothetical protein EGW08_020732 [Elysia chlorotica]|uniref:Deoxynucleoside kinase domain-containing protein n=1 Tax=Elysia chlorotica TaxID=188477 RepID=A0A433SQF3_ELYCH|nr:hypothetical protein EGW08_020732 [Elysia chlorotica]
MNSQNKSSPVPESAPVVRLDQTELEKELNATSSALEAIDLAKVVTDSSESQTEKECSVQLNSDLGTGVEIAVENTPSQGCSSHYPTEIQGASDQSPKTESNGATNGETDPGRTFSSTTNVAFRNRQKRYEVLAYNFDRWWTQHRKEAVSFYDRKCGTFELYVLLILLTANDTCENFIQDAECEISSKPPHVLSTGDVKLLSMLTSLLDSNSSLVRPIDLDVESRMKKLYRRLYELIDDVEPTEEDFMHSSPSVLRYHASRLLQTRRVDNMKQDLKRDIPKKARFVSIEGPIKSGKTTLICDTLAQHSPVSLVGVCEAEQWSNWCGTNYFDNEDHGMDNRFKYHFMVVLTYRQMLKTTVFDPIKQDLLARRAVVLVERSMWSEKEIFIKMSKEGDWIDFTQENILHDVIDLFDIPIHRYVYLYALPQHKHIMYERCQDAFKEQYNSHWCSNIDYKYQALYDEIIENIPRKVRFLNFLSVKESKMGLMSDIIDDLISKTESIY